MNYVIPAVPSSENRFKGRENCWEYREQKKEWARLVALFCRPKPPRPLEHSVVTLRYFFKTKSRHDPNNYSGQFLTDGLVDAGIIRDDDFAHIELRITLGGVDAKAPRVEIDVEEVLT